MREVNRSAIIVMAAQPFLDWARAVDPTNRDLTLGEINREPVVYLVPECESDEEFADWIAENFDDIFEEQLGGWWTDEKSWPSNRTLQLFYEWFDCRFRSLVLDVTPGRLSHLE